jgi:PTH2 family peptidyl-tRNA hydrolase
MFKQVIAVRADLKMGKGKLAAQAAHASLGAYRNAPAKARDGWESAGEKKVVVKVGSLDELEGLHRKARSLGIPCSLIHDAGSTQLEPGTATALGLGPAEEKELDKLTGKLKLA